MMRARIWGAAAIMALATAISAAAQTPTQGSGAAASTGTSTISGVLLDEEATPKPVRRAIISLTSPDLRPNRGAVTDDDGHFSITNLPAGRFTLTATRATYLTSIYGAKRPGRPGTAIAIADGQHLDVRVTIWRGAAVAGIVRDEQGAPLEGARVTATPSHPSDSTVLTLTNNGVRTNAKGEYRIFGLAPGSYVLSVTPTDSQGGPLTSWADADVDAAFDAIRAHSTLPPTGAVATGAANGQPLTPFEYTPIFFPGTPRRTQATPIVLAAGQEADGLDIQISRVTVATIDGVIVAPAGQALHGSRLQLTPVAGTVSPEDAIPVNAGADRDGHFSIPQIPPGDYELLASASADADGNDPGRRLWGHTTLSIVGGDLHGVTVPLEPGVPLKGQIRLETVAGETSVPDVSQWLILLPAATEILKPGTPTRSMASDYSIRVGSDGTFAVTGVGPVAHVLRFGGPGLASGPWLIKSATLNGRNLLDGPFDVTAADAGGTIVLTASTQHSKVSGRLQTATGAGASDVFVIAFSADPALWGSGLRRVQAVRPDVDGRYTFLDLPAGNYRLAAVTDVDPDESQDAAFLATLVPASVTFHVGDGDGEGPTLRIGG